jgi:hypothetical protein
MRIAKTALGVAILGSLLFSGASAFGATAPAGGAIQIWGTPSATGSGGSAVFTGAIAGSANLVAANSSGKPDTKGGYKLVKLKTGTILLNGTNINKVLNNAPPTEFNSTTCSGSFTGAAPVPIVSGTGAYAGISGTANITVTFAVVLPLTKGKCNQNTNANPIAQYGSISGAGTVSFG